MPNEAFCLSKSQTFGLEQTIWVDPFWGIGVSIFGRFISTHFGTVGPLSMLSINQPLFDISTKKNLYIQIPKDLNLGRKELGI